MTIGSKAVEISGLRGAAALRARIGERMALALKPIKLEPVSAHIAFFDDNGPKGGGIRCAFTVRLPYRPALRVEHTAETARLASTADSARSSGCSSAIASGSGRAAVRRNTSSPSGSPRECPRRREQPRVELDSTQSGGHWAHLARS